MSAGVVYWNSGTKLLVRLCVSLASLRDVYDGPVTIILNNDVPKEFESILNSNGFDTIRVETEVGHKNALLSKTIMHMVTPYDTTIYVDCDTLIIKNFDELFDIANEHKFVVTKFADWPSHINKRPRAIAKRIRQWGDKKILDEERLNRAYDYGWGINVGVYAFSGKYEDDNCASIWDDWYNLAKEGIDTFIPDEISCQILLPDHQHYLAPKIYNTSCKFDKIEDDTRIIHYHGRKHCNTEKTKHSTNSDGKCSAELWIEKLKETHSKDWCNFRKIRSKWNDRQSKWIKL